MRRPALLLLLALSAPRALSAQLQVTAGAADIGISGRLHVQYSRSSVEGDQGPANAIDDVLIRRARIQLNLRVNDFFDARIEPDWGGGGAAGAGLADAWARLTFAPAFRLSIGQFKRAFSTFELHSSTDLPIIERDGRVESVAGCPGVASVCTFSRFTERLQFDDRDLGLRAEGAFGRVSYLATLTNGDGRNAADSNDGKSHSIRVIVNPVSSLRVAGFLARHDYTIPLGDLRASAVGGDLEWGAFRDGFHLIVGGVWGDNWLVHPDSEFKAAQGLASFYIPLSEGGKFAGVEPMFRISWSGTDDINEVNRTATLLTPGIALYVVGKNWIGLNVDRYDPDFQPSEWSLKLQAFMFF